MDPLIPTKRPDLVLINKKKRRTCHLENFTVPAGRKVKIKKAKR